MNWVIVLMGVGCELNSAKWSVAMYVGTHGRRRGGERYSHEMHYSCSEKILSSSRRHANERNIQDEVIHSSQNLARAGRNYCPRIKKLRKTSWIWPVRPP
mmetsp:Transcript_39679/g.83432  ORF Transcript_39679/g.83432 Transcript_39679/m.83432 type:complete len:100 (+) Transcript_39679:95-394(+)